MSENDHDKIREIGQKKNCLSSWRNW